MAIAKNALLRSLFKATAIAGAAAAIGLAFWHPLQNEERSHVNHVTMVFARSAQTELLEEMQSEMLEQSQLARHWGLEEKLPGFQREAEAKLFIARHAGQIAVQWVDLDYRVRLLITEPESAAHRTALAELSEIDAPLRRLLQETAVRGRPDVILGPAFRLWNGDTGRHVIVPISRSGQFAGFLVAVIDEKDVIQGVLSGHAGLGYAIAVREGTEEIFRTPGSDPENEMAWGQDAELRLPGALWQVRAWPETELLEKTRSKLPAVLLAMGSAIGLLLFLAVDLARSVYSKSQGLRQAHEELERRVQERTQELRSANQKLEQEIQQRLHAQESLRGLSTRLLNLRDEEQRRIARELHDSTVQTLGAVAIDLGRAQQLVQNGGGLKAQALLARTSELAEQAISELRTISYLLHPPILDDLGLEAVLPWYTAGFSTRSGIAAKVQVQPNLGRFSGEIELALFRILQEGLANIHRHSGSSTVEITVGRDSDRVTLQIVDHGCGIQPTILEMVRRDGGGVGVGIAGMRERLRQIGGDLQIDSNGDGTSIVATAPVKSTTPVTPG